MVTFCIISCLCTLSLPENVNSSLLTVIDVHYGFLGYHVWDFKLSPARNLIYRKVNSTDRGLINNN